jgi:hypothetical protein
MSMQGSDFPSPSKNFPSTIFSIKDRFLARFYALGKPFALLLPLTALEGTVRQKYYRAYGVQLLFLPKRVW